MILVTGGAGFIGSHLVAALNAMGRDDIIVVDDLQNGRKFHNLVNCQIVDLIDKDQFLEPLAAGQFQNIEVIFHQGACSTTTEWDGRYMLQYNYHYSKALLDFALRQQIPMIYASSAAVYGSNRDFRELPENECPLNVYGYSKLLFDQHVRRLMPSMAQPVVGLRYFNVYGAHEAHKGSMASVFYHFRNQLLEKGVIQLFSGNDEWADGEQRRDFVYVKDIAALNIWCWQHASAPAIVNAGTGQSCSFNEIAQALIDHHGHGQIDYIPMPQHLVGAYQDYTQADLSGLRDFGYDQVFTRPDVAIADMY